MLLPEPFVDLLYTLLGKFPPAQINAALFVGVEVTCVPFLVQFIDCFLELEFSSRPLHELSEVAHRTACSVPFSVCHFLASD